MPSLLTQASLNETVDVMIRQNRAMEEIPEVASVVGKAGRADSPLDPAPVGMIETVITLKPEDTWREGVTSDSILTLLRRSVRMPGIAPSWLQHIETRIVMLQSGIVTSIGLEIRGDDADQLERVAIAAEELLSEIPGAVNVQALRTTRRPYLEVSVDRIAAGDHGLTVNGVLSALRGALSGTVATSVLNGRERIPVRVRYTRENRDEPGDIGDIYIPGHMGSPVLLSTVASVEAVDGPAVIRSVDGELTGYVMLNAMGRDEGGLVQEADRLLRDIVERERTMSPGTQAEPARGIPLRVDRKLQESGGGKEQVRPSHSPLSDSDILPDVPSVQDPFRSPDHLPRNSAPGSCRRASFHQVLARHPDPAFGYGSYRGIPGGSGIHNGGGGGGLHSADGNMCR